MVHANRRSLFEYTVDISPCTEAPVKSFLYHSVPEIVETSVDKEANNFSHYDDMMEQVSLFL